jgi:hypothetical protein
MVKITNEEPNHISALWDGFTEISFALASDAKIDEVLKLFSEKTKQWLEADIAICHAYDQKTDTYTLVADTDLEFITENRKPSQYGPTRTITNTGEKRLSNNALVENTPFRDSEYTKEKKLQSTIGFPCKKDDEITGILYVNYFKPNQITSEVIKRGEHLAHRAGVAIYNARRSQEQERLLTRLLSIVDKTAVVTNPIFGPPRPDEGDLPDIFVITPLKDELKPVFRQIKKVATELKLTCKKGDDFHNAKDIREDIWAAICHSQICIADYTGKNPNVFYEIGIAHTIGKSVILIAHSSDFELPFNIKPMRAIPYDITKDDDVEKFKTALTKTIRNELHI